MTFTSVLQAIQVVTDALDRLGDNGRMFGSGTKLVQSVIECLLEIYVVR